MAKYMLDQFTSDGVSGRYHDIMDSGVHMRSIDLSIDAGPKC